MTMVMDLIMFSATVAVSLIGLGMFYMHADDSMHEALNSERYETLNSKLDTLIAQNIECRNINKFIKTLVRSRETHDDNFLQSTETYLTKFYKLSNVSVTREPVDGCISDVFSYQIVSRYTTSKGSPFQISHRIKKK